MRSENRTWMLVGLVTMAPVLAFVSIEGLQRYRYSALKNEVRALLRDIQAEIKLDIDRNGRIRMVGPNERDRGGAFELHGNERGGGGHEEKSWYLTYVFGNSEYSLAEPVAYVFAARVEQDRRLFLLSPRVTVECTKVQDPLLVGKLDLLVRARGLIRR